MPKTKIVEITEKFTKKNNFAALRECVLEHADWFHEGEADRLVEFIDHEVELLDKRAASAKKYAKKNVKAEDAIADAIVEVIANVDEAMTIPEIVAAINPELLATPQKLTYRLNKMVEAGTVAKNMVSVKEEGKTARKINCYKWVGAVETEDAPVEE